MKRLAFLVALINIIFPNISKAQSPDGDRYKQPFSLSISAAKTKLKTGAPVQITIRLTNLSDHPISASSSWESGTDMSYDYDVRDASGHPDERKKRGDQVSDTSKIRTLSPGQSLEEATVVSGAYDMSRPGTYLIQLARTIPGENGGAVKSNTLTVTVTP